MNIGNPEEQVRLKELAGKIKDLLTEYDVAAMVNLQGRDQAEHLLAVSPSWSCMTICERPEGMGLRIKAACSTGGDSEREKLRLTVGMVLAFIHVGEVQDEMMRTCANMISKHMSVGSVIVDQ